MVLLLGKQNFYFVRGWREYKTVQENHAATKLVHSIDIPKYVVSFCQ